MLPWKKTVKSSIKLVAVLAAMTLIAGLVGVMRLFRIRVSRTLMGGL